MKEFEEKNNLPNDLPSPPSVGQYAHSIIENQYYKIIKQEHLVLVDEDPEPLHQMRVATRRLRTAIQVFQPIISLPKTASDKRLKSLAQALGRLRDLDVQIADLQTTYRPKLNKHEKKQLDSITQLLNEKRKKTYTRVKNTFRQPKYYELKSSYEAWITSPRFSSLEKLEVQTLLPDLLSPLLSRLLLHPGWLISSNDSSSQAKNTLHDLRKACKHTRYQSEFFTPFYGKNFQIQIEKIKQLQEKLGKLQDTHVLQNLLDNHLPKNIYLLALEKYIQETQSELLSDWDAIRMQYLDPLFRYGFYQILIEPIKST